MLVGSLRDPSAEVEIRRKQASWATFWRRYVHHTLVLPLQLRVQITALTSTLSSKTSRTLSWFGERTCLSRSALYARALKNSWDLRIMDL
jgi:hypothetical protein